MKKNQHVTAIILGIFMLLCAASPQTAPKAEESTSRLLSLLPEWSGWSPIEQPQSYFSETLFEYINGAAEVYLSYDFEELLVAQLVKVDGEANVSIEIYDMGDTLNSFGIYSAERYPESRFVSSGIQGYIDEGALNFLAGRYYIKLLCFDCEEEADDILLSFSKEITQRVGDVGGYPAALGFFPQKGLIPNSEKFILRNFMGYSFLHHGYLANYRLEDMEFDCFCVEGSDEDEAQDMLEQYLAARPKDSTSERAAGYLVKDRYYQKIYIARVKNFLCGVLKIKEGAESVGEEYLSALAQAVGK